MSDDIIEEEDTLPIDSGDDLRDSLAAQFDAAGIEDEETPAPAPEASAETPEATEQEPAPVDDTPEAVTAEDATPEPALKAPVDWSATEREQWSKIPKDVQERIHEREKVMADSMANTAQARDTHGRMAQLGNSYASILSAEGVSDPIQAAEGLFKTVAQLRLGSPQQKAQQISQLIEHYGVDIQALDQVLVGTQPASQNAELEQMVQQRMQPYEQMMQQQAQQQEFQKQQAASQANEQVKQFSQKAEFLNDVRNDMANLIDQSAQRGEQMDIQKAYDMACALNPSVSQVIEQRKQTAAITGQQQSLQTKRAAASSLNGRIGNVASGTGNLSLREQLTASMDALGDS